MTNLKEDDGCVTRDVSKVKDGQFVIKNKSPQKYCGCPEDDEKISNQL